MYHIAKPKFALSERVKLRFKYRTYLPAKNPGKGSAKIVLAEFFKGHEFTVIEAYPSHKASEVKEAFDESSEVINVEFFYEVSDGDCVVTLPEECLKRVKLQNAAPIEDDEEEVEESPVVKKPLAKGVKPVLAFVKR